MVVMLHGYQKSHKCTRFYVSTLKFLSDTWFHQFEVRCHTSFLSVSSIPVFWYKILMKKVYVLYA